MVNITVITRASGSNYMGDRKYFKDHLHVPKIPRTPVLQTSNSHDL
jgi:hypothetical protein